MDDWIAAHGAGRDTRLICPSLCTAVHFCLQHQGHSSQWLHIDNNTVCVDMILVLAILGLEQRQLYITNKKQIILETKTVTCYPEKF